MKYCWLTPSGYNPDQLAPLQDLRGPAGRENGSSRRRGMDLADGYWKHYVQCGMDGYTAPVPGAAPW